MITDKTSGWIEATITINGVELSFAQSMAVRVAVSSYRMFINEESNRDHLGHRLVEGYDEALLAVEVLMHKRD